MPLSLPGEPVAEGPPPAGIVVDEGHRSYGAGAELAAVIAEGAFWSLDAPVRRLAALDVPVPFSPPLEDVTVPTPDLVARTARELCNR